jgi:hypothetical protein
MEDKTPQLGMFGGRLGGRMSATDELTLFLLRLHQDAVQRHEDKEYMRDLLLRLESPTGHKWQQKPLNEIPMKPKDRYTI